MIDCADLVRVKVTGEQWLVCCVHDHVVHLNQPGQSTVRLDDIELVQAATDTERQGLLRRLAGSTGQGHRPACARARLAAIQEQSE